MKPALAFLPLLFAGLVQAAPSDAARTVEIRRTTFGIPHVLAADERGLGYGLGHAYAQDNLCLLAQEVVTVNGERARHFGPDGELVPGLGNVGADVFFRWFNTDAAVDTFLREQPAESRDLIAGYAEGYNRHLADTPVAARPAACGGEPWLRPITPADVARLIRRLLVEGGIGQFAGAVPAASPPGGAPAQAAAAADPWQHFAETHGSNAIALGGKLSDNGRGILLGNPHFPWSGALRFYQSHLTIPGKLDVMGASLPGFPAINIGFNRHLAWSHTVDTSLHFTVYRLQLDPADPTRYLVDGQSEAMTRTPVRVEVRQPDGRLGTVEHVVYGSRHGPVVAAPGGFAWDRQQAFAIRDANLGNTRALQQWYTMNKARSLEEFRSGIERLVGIPWVNTLAADSRGEALYLNVSVIPNLAGQPATCSLARTGGGRVLVLDGSRSACRWTEDPRAPQAGIVPTAELPRLARRDFVQNSNDSAWLTNPAEPLSGFAPAVSAQDVELGSRARFALSVLNGRLAAGAPRLGPDDLVQLVSANRVHQADLVMDDVLQLCGDPAAAAPVTATACRKLADWDRTANLDTSPGYLLFEAFAGRAEKVPEAWARPFDPREPLTTPRGLNLNAPAVHQALLQALHDSASAVDRTGWGDAASWGAVQARTLPGGHRVPIPGGDGRLGTYNAITSIPTPAGREVVAGSSYMQVVSFTEGGPEARALLAFSQSSDPASPHARDQTWFFSSQRWVRLPFAEQDIRQDAAYRRTVLTMPPAARRP